jgi:hypothetical protein
MNMWAILMLLSGGLFTGGVTVIAWERVRVWHALPLPQFRPEFAATIDVADRVQPALLVASIVSTVGFAITGAGPPGGSRSPVPRASLQRSSHR